MGCHSTAATADYLFLSGFPRVLRGRLGACVRREEGWGFRTMRSKVAYRVLGLAHLFPLAGACLGFSGVISTTHRICGRLRSVVDRVRPALAFGASPAKPSECSSATTTQPWRATSESIMSASSAEHISRKPPFPRGSTRAQASQKRSALLERREDRHSRRRHLSSQEHSRNCGRRQERRVDTGGQPLTVLTTTCTTRQGARPRPARPSAAAPPRYLRPCTASRRSAPPSCRTRAYVSPAQSLQR